MDSEHSAGSTLQSVAVAAAITGSVAAIGLMRTPEGGTALYPYGSVCCVGSFSLHSAYLCTPDCEAMEHGHQELILNNRMMSVSDIQPDFQECLRRLNGGDFSQLEPLFISDQLIGRPCHIIQWHKRGLFKNQIRALSEALTCACFLGRTDAAEYLLGQGVDPSGGANTGLNAFHWAVNRGQLEATRLLIRWKTPLAPRTMYGGNVLDTAVWSAINEPRGDQLAVIEELLKAGARLENENYPTGHRQVDSILRRYRSPQTERDRGKSPSGE